VKRPTRLLSIVAGLLAAAFVAGCSDEATGPSTPALAVAGALPTTTITHCSQPDGATSGWIGSKGGRLKAGGHYLSVPAGALSAPTFITMETPSGDIGHVVFTPEGLTFNRNYPAHLVMSYQDCSLTPGTVLEVGYVSQSLMLLE
jgi:hypothetical protein